MRGKNMRKHQLTRFGELWDRTAAGNGHRMLGRVTLYAFGTAMHGAINVRIFGSSLCLAWPRLGRRSPRFGAYCYYSKDGTPDAAAWSVGTP